MPSRRPARTAAIPSRSTEHGPRGGRVPLGAVLAIASLAKVMTAYLTLERYPLSGEEDGFTTTITAAEAQAEARDAAQGQSGVAVQAGERLTERQLLEALLIPSGNNIAGILAAQVADSEPSFVAEMNAEARALGMDHTILIAEGYAGKTGSDTAGEGCLAFFTHVTVGGRWQTAVGVVMGQGQGGDTSALLAAAGDAAERLVDSRATRFRP